MGQKQPFELGVMILAAGEGKRMKSDIPKMCHQLVGMTLLQHVVEACMPLSPSALNVVVSPQLQQHKAFYAHSFLSKLPTTLQPKPRGTADAVMRGLADLPRRITHVMILCGDVPTLSTELLQLMVKNSACDAVWVGAHLEPCEQHLPYGRIVTYGRNGSSKPVRIVEWVDATEKERSLDLINSGLYLFSRSFLERGLQHVMNSGEKDEYYLTDLMAWGGSAGYAMQLLVTDHASVSGVNTRADLAQAHDVLQKRWRQKHMDAGVTFINASQITLARDTQLGCDTIVEGPVWFGHGVVAHERVTIYPFTSLEDCVLHADTAVGPFARIRGNTILDSYSQVGNFVEIKGSHLGEHAKVKHLAYIGDTNMGKRVNVGAGTITCNYDGVRKHPTTIEEGAHIGANVSLVAPITIGANAVVGAGSVITKHVEENTLALERTAQISKPRKKRNTTA